MSATTQSRQPKGIPVGGQFATSERPEADVSLVAVASEDEQDLTPVETSYEFPAWKVAAAVASIEKANRRAERAGIPERFAYQVETWEVRSTDPETGLDVIEKRARLHLDRPSVQHDGWTFAATLTWDEEAGMISRSAPGAVLIERPTERLCDVCGKQRDRRDTYVVQRDGVQMQVGSDCLQRFMGIKPAGLWMLDFEPERSEGASEPSDGLRGEDRRDSAQMIGLGLAVVEKHGWLSRSAAGHNQVPTADRVLEALHGKPRRDEDKVERDRLIARGRDLAAEAEEILGYARNIEGDSDYLHNLRQIASAETVSSRNLPLLLSAIASSRVAKEKAAEAKARTEARDRAAAESKWVGQKKDKVENIDVTVLSTRVVEQTYGYHPSYSTIVTMRDADGNQWKWFASGNKEDEIKPGMRATLKGTIKGHDEWQGVKETAITRATLVPEGYEPPSVPKVPAANPANPYADVHTVDAINTRWNRQQGAWKRSGKLDDPEAMAQADRDFRERYDELLEAQREARRAEYAAEHGTPAPVAPKPPPPR